MFKTLTAMFAKHTSPIRTQKNRQWGTEKDFTPLPILHEKPSVAKVALNRIAIVLTIFFWLSYISSIIIRQLIDGPQTYDFTTEAFSYTLVVSFLTFSSLVYLITRLGALERFKKHTRVPKATLDAYFSKNKPSITVLVPSYKEEYAVIRQTLLSAALQEFPSKRIMLLVDDNPHSKNPHDIEALTKTRGIPEDISTFLADPRANANRAMERFSTIRGDDAYKQRINNLIDAYRWTINWLRYTASQEPLNDHVDQFFTSQVFGELANDLYTIAEALEIAKTSNEPIAMDRLRQLHQSLIWIFTAEIDVFERKQYDTLSHEANKAMNLNAYIGIMGGTYIENHTEGRLHLETVASNTPGSFHIPDSDYLLTLDADSILLREYCLRLVYLLEEPENARIAVAQTPYSSFRGAYSRIERLAGATTDIQHLLHQGMTYYDATFWVGANAVIRKAALNDIVEIETEHDTEVKRFIQDRTVIEDTESSIDLSMYGWKLYNYPERLSYSATPPDFGSLVVQRRRWANGGLIILAKLWDVVRHRKNQNELISRMEILLRINYLISIAWATFGLIFLLAYPYDGRLLSPLILLAALPYFLTVASDLRYNGYNGRDVLSIYGFNLILLPVNFAGVLKSIEQSLTASKIPFARTPKVKDRTPSGMFYVIMPLCIVAFSVFTVWRNVAAENWGNAAFAGFNAITASWAIFAYIGLGNVVADIWLGINDWLYVEVKPKIQQPTQDYTVQTANWKQILYQGTSAHQ